MQQENPLLALAAWGGLKLLIILLRRSTLAVLPDKGLSGFSAESLTTAVALLSGVEKSGGCLIKKVIVEWC